MFLIIQAKPPIYVRVIKLTEEHKQSAHRGIIDIINCSTGEILRDTDWTLLPLEDQ